MKESQESRDLDGDFSAVRIGNTNDKGRGLFSTRALAAGDTALVERPLAAMQSLDNAQDVMVCRNCLGFIGDVILQLELLYGLPRHECLQRLEARMDSDAQPRGRALFSSVIECRQGCGEVYCSTECEEEHFDRCHRLLCVGPVPVEEAPSHPLVGFRVHAAQTNEIFLLVGEVVARIVSGHVLSGQKMDDAEAPFKDFVQEAWWDVALARDDDGGLQSHKGATAASQKAEALPQTLRKLCAESSSYLSEALAASGPLTQILSTRRFGTVIGMFEQNNVGIRVQSPIRIALEALVSEVEESEEAILMDVARLIQSMNDARDSGSSECCSDEGCDEEYRACDGVDDGFETGEMKCNASPDVHGGGCVKDPEVGLGTDDEVDVGDEICTDHARAVVENSLEDSFAPLDGTALYTLICAMNHSCRPNCAVRYCGRGERSRPGKAEPLAAHVILLEDVDEGVELSQSYINEEMCLEDRRRALEEYGFHCTCNRCREEESLERNLPQVDK